MNLATMTTDQVMSVYSGKPNRCCCGCSGNHRYNSKHVAAAGKDRGYSIDADEVNDVQVKKVLNLVKSAPNAEFIGDNIASAEINGRLYVVYGVK